MMWPLMRTQALLPASGVLPQEARADQHAAFGVRALGRHGRAAGPDLRVGLHVARRRLPQPGRAGRRPRRHHQAQPGGARGCLHDQASASYAGACYALQPEGIAHGIGTGNDHVDMHRRQ